MRHKVLNMESYQEQLEEERLKRIGLQIKRLRKAQKMSQTELGERVGLSRRSISEIENGGNTTLASFIRILHLFSRLEDFDHLLESTPISPKAAFEAQSKYGLK